MSTPTATFLLPDGVEVEVHPGGIVGRLAHAAVFIDDPRISEAHAMLSLRGGWLVLLALRGTLTVGRRPATRIKLKPGLLIELVPGVQLEVTRVELPEVLLALEEAGQPPLPLLGSVYSVPRDPAAPVESGYLPDAVAHLWCAANGWRARVGQEGSVALRAGEELVLGARRLRVVEQASEDAGVGATIQAQQSVGGMVIVARFETVHLHSPDGTSIKIPGIGARIICELVSFGAPVPWEMAARTLWQESDLHALRCNWDRHLGRLRARLRDAGIRDNLVQPDGRGNVELFLLPGDRIQDEM